ncbi:DUF452 family protein [Campylobacter upsaliensis]|nr:DUF452 family protein [Campylobacter upsaliensis]EGK8068871.1 DUF452 family protein [Campylobacter upsaliensis]EJX8728843.1 DUF452 family protein [Campylobacter upsaliensis]
MKIEFLHQNANSKELILFFAGFASQPSHFSHLNSQKNVLMVYDYRDFEFKFDLNAFENITLIAFSMGVCVASKVLKNFHFKAKIALNGTNYGVDKIRGIPPSIFLRTAQNFKLEDFKKALLCKRAEFEFRAEEDLKEELLALYEFCKKDFAKNFTWDRAYMSEGDFIFPNLALKNTYENLICLKEPHFVFFAFDKWEQI